MKFKSFCFNLVLLLCTFSVYSQKTNREWLSYQNTHLPSRLIYDQIKTYAVNLQVNSSNPYNLDFSFAHTLPVSFVSFRQVDISKADLQVSLSIGTCIFSDEKTTTVARDETVNQQKVRTTFYSRVISVKVPIVYKVVNMKNGAVLFMNDASYGLNSTIESGEFRSESEAITYMNTIRKDKLTASITQLCKDFVQRDNATIRDLFDFYPLSNNTEIFYVRKWDSDDEYNGHIKNIQAAFKIQTYDEPSTTVFNKIKPDIEYLQQFEGKFNPTDKKESVLYFINYFNLSTIFYCLDDFEKARQYAGKLDSIDNEKNRIKFLKGMINGTQKRVERHYLSGTHINYNPVSDYRLADKNVISDASNESEKMAVAISSGKIAANDKVLFSDNRELIGKVMITKETGELKFLPNESPDKPLLLTPLNTVQITVDSLSYVAAKAQVPGVGISKYFFLLQYVSPNIKLLQFVNNTLSLTDAFHLAYLRPGEEIITFATGLGMKKRLEKYFEDCPAVGEKIKQGEFGGAMSKDVLGNLKKLCVEYDACK